MDELRKFKCTRCNQLFQSGDWNGCGGNQFRLHVIEAKTYYHRNASFLVSVEKPQRVVDQRTGQAMNTPGKVVQFMGGQYMTKDPAEQEFLDTKTYWLTSEQYANLNLTPELKAARAQTQAKDALRLKDKAEQELLRVQGELAEARAKLAETTVATTEHISDVHGEHLSDKHSDVLPDPMIAARSGKAGRKAKETVGVGG